MTQPDGIAPQPAPTQITEASIWERICAQASELLERPADNPLRFGQFGLGHLFVFWKGEPNGDGSVPARGVTVYERGKPAPIKTSLGIMAIFGFADDFVRVYAIPIDPAGKDLGPARITLSRVAPVPSAFVEYMPMDQFVAEIASEVANDLGMPDDDEEPEEGDEGADEGESTTRFTPA